MRGFDDEFKKDTELCRKLHLLNIHEYALKIIIYMCVCVYKTFEDILKFIVQLKIIMTGLVSSNIF